MNLGSRGFHKTIAAGLYFRKSKRHRQIQRGSPGPSQPVEWVRKMQNSEFESLYIRNGAMYIL